MEKDSRAAWMGENHLFKTSELLDGQRIDRNLDPEIPLGSG
jgi:hypothetical protein